jgi:hypothetical protein
MTDLLMVALFTGFFGLALLFVKGCERIVGADVENPVADETEPAEDVAA